MSKGFKKISFESRADLLHMPNAALKVWMAHYLRSDKDDKVEMSNEQLMRECDLGLSTVKIAKRWLKDNGHLHVDTAAYKDELGRWISPELTAVLPGLENNPGEEDQGSNPTYGPGLESNPTSRVEKAAAVNATLPVDTLLAGVDTLDSDADASSIDTEKEAVEERRSASAAFLPAEETGETPATPINEDDDEWERSFNEHVINDYLIPVAKTYGLNGNCREEAATLLPLLKASGVSEIFLAPAIEYARSIEDTFVADRISTWSGLKKMMKPDGVFFGQFRKAEKLASKLNNPAYQKAIQDSHGTAAYGSAIAKIIADKKAKKK